MNIKPKKSDKNTVYLRNWLQNNEIYFKTIATLLLSLMAIIISIAQINISKKQTILVEMQTEISKKSYNINITPIISAEFDIDLSKRKYDIIIYNNGSIPIIDLCIRYKSRLLDPKNIEYSGSMTMLTELPIASELSVGQSIKVSFDSNFINHFSILKEPSWLKRSDLPLPIFSAQITYKRKEDNQKFKLNKYAVFSLDSNRNIGKPIDLDIVHPKLLNKENLVDWDNKYF